MILLDSSYGDEKPCGSTTARAVASLPDGICAAQGPPSWSGVPLRRKSGGTRDAVWQAQLRLRQRQRQLARPLLSALLEGKGQDRLAATVTGARYPLPSMGRQSSAPPIHYSTDAEDFPKGMPPPPAG